MTPNRETKIFPLSLLDTSEKNQWGTPLPQRILQHHLCLQLVLDTKVLAIVHKTKQSIPFQVLTWKLMKESAQSAKVQVIVQALDLMRLNGKSLLDKTLV